MIWILLLYVLPLMLGVMGAYLTVKKNGGSMMEFLEPLPFLLIPLVNILFVLACLFFLIQEWIENDESIQNFLDKKL